jgi:hypothetical protein
MKITTSTNGLCATAKTTIRNKDVAMGIESEEIAESLTGDDGAEDRIVLRNHFLEKYFQGFPDAAAEIGKKIPIIKK